ncbi:TetR family transcriptional regulator [Clostridium botulinum]|nr:TetR family transcriptional regulator [Clostridium botulinum]MCS4518901.1 TetR family transcriptional regulator [Clostridium botulinum]
MNVNEYNQRKQHILEAAIMKFTENGFDKTSLREIASAAGLTTGAIYHHLKIKMSYFTMQ